MRRTSRLEDEVWQDFFDKLEIQTRPRRPTFVVVSHVLPDTLRFLRALLNFGDIHCVIPKPNSIHQPSLRSIEADGLAVRFLDRTKLRDPRVAVDLLFEIDAEHDIVVLDVGGYFAAALPELSAQLQGRLLGVVEDTENGHRRYEATATSATTRVLSVARSPLKETEDFLVGRAIATSVEGVIRGCGDTVAGMRAAVLGYGKIGLSLTEALRDLRVETVVYDPDPVRLSLALARGNQVEGSAARALADVDIVIGASGQCSLSRHELCAVPHRAYVASATSSDDELAVDYLRELQKERLSDFVDRYRTTASKEFLLIHKGNAVNFIGGGSAGPFVHLVQAEILAASAALCADPTPGRTPRMEELDTRTRAELASRWLTAVGGEQH